MVSKKLSTIVLSMLGIVAILAGVVALSLTNEPAAAAPNQQSSAPRTITVTGTGEVNSAPNIAYVSIGVNVGNEDVNVAVEEANAKIDAVIAALNAQGVATEDIRTEVYNIYQDFGKVPTGPDGMAEGEPQPIYRVNIFLNVTVRDIENVATTVAAGLEAGANAMNGINFGIADRSALESEARKLALANARAKAEEIASELGLTIVAPEHVEEISGGFYPGPMYAMGGGGGGGGISTGTLAVSLSLNVTYSFE